MFARVLTPILCAGALALAGCASNYAGEGALVGGAAGAGIGALTNGDVGTSAAVGAAVGGAVGATQHKHSNCYRYDSSGHRYYVC